MTLYFIDSFDHYTGQYTRKKWTQAAYGQSITTGRNGNGCVLSTIGAGLFIHKSLASSYNTLCAGVAFKTNMAAGVPLTFRTPYLDYISVGINMQSQLYVFANCAGGSDSSVPFPNEIHLDTWYYLELKATGGTDSIYYEVYLNEELIGSGTLDVGTRYNGPDPIQISFNEVVLQGPPGGTAIVVDDFYCGDTIIGDVIIGVIRPNGDTAISDWDAVPAGAHFERVNDVSPDTSDYVESGTVSERDIYTMEDIGDGDVYGAQGLTYARKSEEGSGMLKMLWQTEGSIIEGATKYPSADDYWYQIEMMTLNPVTNLPWTVQEINDLQFGVKRV